MDVIQLATPAHFARCRIDRVGLYQNRLFVACKNDKELQLWSVHCLVPSSWTLLFHRNFHELFYTHCAVSSAQNAIFVLVAAFFANENLDGGICILRFDLSTEELSEFWLDPEYATKFEEVTLERVGLGCGQREGQLFLHDRTMVTGAIPFWRISLHPDRMTFSIRSQPILDDQQVCSSGITRFPIVLDGDSRTVLRITDDFQVFLYDGNFEKWERLEADEQNGLKLSSISVRGISETFGHNWHRFCAIESKLSIFADNNFCIFKVLQNGVHNFHRFYFSRERKTFNLQECSRVRLDKRLDTLCFVHCSPRRMAFVNKHWIGFVHIQPPPLREICFWGIQKQFAKRTNGTKIWNGGKTTSEIQKLFNMNQGLQIAD